MEIMTYVQARVEIVAEMSEQQISRILTISGRAREWIGRIMEEVAKNESLSDIAIVEQAGMGKAILAAVPQAEWIYLLNPSMAPDDSMVVRENIVVNGKVFSPTLCDWLMAQEIGLVYKLCDKSFTPDEAKIMRALWQKQEMIVDREEVAQSLWGESWSEKYSDWGIDASIHRLRLKLSGRWQLLTIKGRGYMLAGVEKQSSAAKAALDHQDRIRDIPGSIYPSDEYINYMNDAKKLRKVYQDLMQAMKQDGIKLPKKRPEKILCINSYSYDNVDAIEAWVKANGWYGTKVYFVHYDPRAVTMHQDRIKELGCEDKIESIYDDMRESKLVENNFDIVINDFRLNFNQNDLQNKAMMGHIQRVMHPQGVALISTVVDGRYESEMYGIDQEKAPINASKPGLFQADEHLVRRCWSVPYFKKLFTNAGFGKIVEFDIEGGKAWGQTGKGGKSWTGPYYRRWVLRKATKTTVWKRRMGK